MTLTLNERFNIDGGYIGETINGLIELFNLVVILMTVRPYLSQMMTEYIYIYYIKVNLRNKK